jgi:ribose 1,5-bisphosphokinase PhnN
MYSYLITGYLLLDELKADQEKMQVAKRYIKRSLAASKEKLETIKLGLYEDLSEEE